MKTSGVPNGAFQGLNEDDWGSNGAFQGLNEDEWGSQWSFSRVK